MVVFTCQFAFSELRLVWYEVKHYFKVVSERIKRMGGDWALNPSILDPMPAELAYAYYNWQEIWAPPQIFSKTRGPCLFSSKVQKNQKTHPTTRSAGSPRNSDHWVAIGFLFNNSKFFENTPDYAIGRITQKLKKMVSEICSFLSEKHAFRKFRCLFYQSLDTFCYSSLKNNFCFFLKFSKFHFFGANLFDKTGNLFGKTNSEISEKRVFRLKMNKFRRPFFAWFLGDPADRVVGCVFWFFKAFWWENTRPSRFTRKWLWFMAHSCKYVF